MKRRGLDVRGKLTEAFAGLDQVERDGVSARAWSLLEDFEMAVALEKAVHLKNITAQPTEERTLAQLRKERGYMQKEVARAMGLSVSTLSYIEDSKKDTRAPFVLNVDAYLRALGGRLRQLVRIPGREDVMLTGPWMLMKEQVRMPQGTRRDEEKKYADMTGKLEKSLLALPAADRDALLEQLRVLASCRRRIVEAGRAIADVEVEKKPETCLRDLRRSFGLTLADMGVRLGITKSSATAFETQDNPGLATLARYVAAIAPGAKLLLVAEFFDRQPPVFISGLLKPGSPTASPMAQGQKFTRGARP